MRLNLVSPKKALMGLAAAGIIPAAVSAQDADPYGPQFGGRFKDLTGEIFPSSEHHLTDKLSFLRLYRDKKRLSSAHGIE